MWGQESSLYGCYCYNYLVRNAGRTFAGFYTQALFMVQMRQDPPRGTPSRRTINTSCRPVAWRKHSDMTGTPTASEQRPGDADFQLVQRTVAGDQKAYGLLVMKYQRRIERLIGRMVRDVDLVPDLAQETFLRAYRALPQFRGEAQFYTWLYRIAVNTAKKAMADLSRNPVMTESALRSAADDDEENFAPGRELISDETPETVIAAKEIAEAVNTAMDALPEDLRQAIVLREIDGLSYEDIAAAMDCPIGTVRSRIFRAREAISAKVKPMLERQSGKRW